MAKEFDVEIITPERMVFQGKVQSVTAVGKQGAFGILVDHAPFITELQTSILSITEENDKTTDFALDGGFLEVVANKAVVLTDRCVTRDEVNVEQTEAEKKAAEDILVKETTSEERESAKASLKRSEIWLSLAGR